jgi:hypothetical protein
MIQYCFVEMCIIVFDENARIELNYINQLMNCFLFVRNEIAKKKGSITFDNEFYDILLDLN